MTVASLNISRIPCQSRRQATFYDLEQDHEFVSRLRAGDDDAYETFFRTYSGRMLAVARRILGDNEDCADAVQEAFVSAFQAIDKFEQSSTLSTWLHRIVINACLM